MLAAAASGPKYPVLVWNRSPSVPVGLYLVLARPAHVGDYVATRLSGTMQALAERRSYIGPNTPVLKRVAASEGDRVCRRGRIVQIAEERFVIALVSDRQGRQLPVWQGCYQLQNDQRFVLGTHLESFDSRYFGPINREQIVGVAIPIFTIQL